MSAAHFVEAGDKLAAKHRRERLHRKGEAAAGVNRRTGLSSVVIVQALGAVM
jgi:hypothetical protein